jgi:predicted dithiol-disulfide oxidoreductase (DUF899 family)
MKVATPTEWLSARKSLLQKEKDLTRAQDALAKERRSLPIYPITTPYTFTASDGSTVTLSDLFAGRRQLIIYHFMFSPENDAGCSACSFCADNFPHLSHLNARDTSFVIISRTPIAKINAFKERMGWTFPWYSSLDSQFNYDFHTSMDESKAPIAYNFDDKETLEKKGLKWNLQGEQPGLSCFLMGKKGEGEQKEGQVYHTNSSYARGLEGMLSTYQLLDMTTLGRQDGPGGPTSFEYHDMYGKEE